MSTYLYTDLIVVTQSIRNCFLDIKKENVIPPAK